MEQAADGEPRRGWGFALALAIVGLVITALAFEPTIAGLPVPSFVDRFGALRIGAALGFGLTGAALVAARPQNRIGWLMTAIGLAQAGSMLLENLAVVAMHEPDAGLAGGGWAIAFASALWAPAYLAVPTLFLLLFPDGQLPSPRWRPVAALAMAAMAIAALGWFLLPPDANDVEIFPPGYESMAPTWEHAASLTAIAAVIAVPTAVASIASLFVRYRRAGRRDRAPLGWVFVGAVLTGALLALAFLSGGAGPWIAGLAMLPLPVAVALGVGRQDLWETDGVLKQTLAAGALSGIALVVYVSIVTVAGALFERTTGASLVATAVIAVLVLPAHRRATRWANEFVYGTPEDPSSVVRRLGRELDSSSRPHEVMSSMCSTLADATGASRVAVVVDGETVASVGAPGGDDEHISLVHAGEPIGELVVGGIPEPDRARRRLLADLAPHVALAAHAQLLERELARSHARLLAAREEERRRLQRDLHDGVGPMMAALALELDRGRMLLAHDPASGEAVFDQLAGHLREAVGAVRTLVHDLRPPPLDELGLAGALEALGRQLAPTSPRIDVVDVGIDRVIPADLELTAYRIASEAMTNVVRHAGAEHCEVSLVVDDDQLVIDVSDDGSGIVDDAVRGAGRRSMTARADEHGGRVDVVTGPSGTTVKAVLPLPAGARR